MDSLIIFVKDSFAEYDRLKKSPQWASLKDRVVFFTTDTFQLFKGDDEVGVSGSAFNSLSEIVDGHTEDIEGINTALDTLEDKSVITKSPSLALTASLITDKEVGTPINDPSFSVTFDKGSYEYGPSDTGVKPTSVVVTFNGKTTTLTSAQLTGLLSGKVDSSVNLDSALTVTDGMSLDMVATYAYSQGSVPKSNLGRNCPDSSRVPAASGKTVKKTLKGFRYAFAGQRTEKTAAIDSTMIRSLSVKDKDKSLSINITSTALRVIIAFPSSWGSLTSVLDKNDSNKNIVSAFTQLSNVDVSGYTAGANLMSYKVYVMTFANAYGSSNTYTATIS